MSELLLPTRRANVIFLRAHAPLSALVAQRVYEEAPSDAVRPYCQYGVPIYIPYEAQGVQKGAIDLTITWHVFDQAHDNDRLYRIMGVLEKALDDAEMEIEGYDLLWLDSTGGQLAPEAPGIPQYRHGYVSFSCGVGKLIT